VGDIVKVANLSRASFRRAGIRFPAKHAGPTLLKREDVSGENLAALEADPRLKVEIVEAETKAKASRGSKSTGADLKRIETAHAKAMTAARKIKDPIKRQAAQDKANAGLEAAKTALK